MKNCIFSIIKKTVSILLLAAFALSAMPSGLHVHAEAEHVQSVTGHVHDYESEVPGSSNKSEDGFCRTNYISKVISILGDSISTFAGYIPTADGYNLEHLARYPQDDLLTDVNETWWMQLISALGARLGINDSWRGATVSGAHPVTTGATGEDAATFNLQRIKNLGANGTPDIIVFYGGTNDYAHVAALGSFDAASAPTVPDFSGVKYDNLADGYVETLLRLKYFYPDALVIAVLPGVTASYYTTEKLAAGNALLSEICEHYGVPYIDLYESALTAGMLPDGIHPGAEGMDVITDALLDLIGTLPAITGARTVYPVTHVLTNAKASLSYYKGVSEGAAFTENVTGKDLAVTVIMGGEDITAGCYADGVISIPAVTAELQITVTGTLDVLSGHLSALPAQVCAGVNLWSVLPHDPQYYSPNQGWGYTTVPAPSVTFEIHPGEKIYASSFGKIGENGSDKHSGIRVTFFSDNGVLVSLDPGAVYSEFEQNGFITAPDGAKYVNVPMWGDNAEWELYLSGRSHVFGGGAFGVCSICGKSLIEMRYDDRLDVSDKEISIISVGSPTSYKVGSDGVHDDAVVCLDNGRLIACGIGEATVSIDGVIYTVSVTAAPMSLFMITGHSIGAGVQGDAALSVVCPDGQVYSSFGTNNLPAATAGVGIGFAAENKAPKIYALNQGGGGTVGEGGGIGLSWNRLTGEKVWIINVAVGGTCLKNWLPGTTAYTNAVRQYTRAAAILDNEIAAGHYTLSHTGVIYHSAANYSYQNVEFTDADLQAWFDQFWGGLKSELDADIDGDGEGDAPEFCAFVPIWTKSAMYVYNTDKPATYCMSASADYPDMFTASVCCRDWLTDGGVYENFPEPDYVTQNGTAPERPLTFNEVFASDRVHLKQVGYNALGMDIAVNVFNYLYADCALSSFALMQTDGVSEVSDNVTLTCGEALTLVPVTEPITVSSLRFVAEGNIEIVYPLTAVPKHNGYGTLYVYVGENLIRTVRFRCEGFDDRIDMRYDDRLDVSDKDVSIIDAGTPTSYKVGYGVAENTPDETVVRIENGKLIACGIGEAAVMIDGVIYTVNVTAAPISLLLLIGQSNMRGSEGNADQSIVCPEGQVYSTYGDDRGASNTEFTVSTARYFAPSALAGEYSTINVEGTTECLSGYPLYTLCEEGSGKMGPDSGFAYEWVKATGEKVWVVNVAHGGTAISLWQKGGKEYNEALLLFTACRQTLQKEVAAGHYTLSHMGYFWCQGCSDSSQTAAWYVNKFTAMHENLKADNAFDHDLDPGTPDITFEFAGIIPILHGLNSYRAGVYNDLLVGAHYESYRTLTFNGPRAAQYLMCSDPGLPDVYMVCDIGAGWMRMPDGSNGVAAYFASHYENGTVDYQTQVPQSASWYKPTTPAAVHDTIHYNQIGYNEVGIESARNILILLGVLPDTEEETTVKFVNWTGYEEVDEITARKSASSETLIVPIVSPCYRSKQVTYTVSEGLNYSYYDLTASSSDVTGTLTAHGAEGSVSVVPREYKTFRFETDNGSFISVGETENNTSLVSGGIVSGVFSNARIALTESIMLDHDRNWVVEIKMTGPWYSDDLPKPKKLLSADGAASTVGAYNVTVNGASDRIWINYYNGTTHVGCGVCLAEYGISVSDTHIYRLCNHINEDGTNQILLYVDGQYVAPVTRYITGSGGDSGTESQMLCGVDLHFGYLGAVNYPLDNGSIEYLHIIESGADNDVHIHSFTTWTTVTQPSAEGAGTECRECEICGAVQTREVDGVWQKYDFAGHLSDLPGYCCETNLWAVLEHDEYFFASGTHWGVHSSGNVRSVTIPVNPGDMIYATSFGKAGENGSATSNGIRTTFFDLYGVIKTYEPSAAYGEFSDNGGYIIAPDNAAFINIAMWTDSDDWEIYILNAPHIYEETVTVPTCTERGYITHTCAGCGDSYVDSYTAAHGHSWGEWQQVTAPTGSFEGSDVRYCAICGESESRTVPVLEIIDVILFAGQSNMCGRAQSGDVGFGTYTVTVPVGKAFTFNNAAGTELLEITEPITANGTSGYGMIPSFLNAYYDETGRRVCACFESHGGTGIDKFTKYKQDSVTGEYTSGRNAYYTRMITSVQNAKASLEALGFEVGGVYLVWCQGENEGYYLGAAPGDYTTEYQSTLTADQQKTDYYIKQFNNIVGTLQDDIDLDKAFIIRIGQRKNDTSKNAPIVKAQNILGQTNDDIVLVTAFLAGATAYTREDGSTVNLMRDTSHFLPEAYYLAGTDAGHNAGRYVSSGCAVKPVLYEYDVNAADYAPVSDGHYVYDPYAAVCLHTYTSEVTAPTCTEQGYMTFTCTECGLSYTAFYVNALGHDLTHHDAQAATCTAIGWAAYDTCSRCDYTTYVEIPAPGHNWSEWEQTTDPTCTAEGVETRICSVCSETETRSVDALGHDYVSTVTEPTCTETGYTTHVCSRCCDTYVDAHTDASGHTVVTDRKVMPTNTKAGLTAGSHCSVCGEVFEAQRSIPAKGFEWMVEDGAFKVMFIGGSYSEDATNSGQGMTTSRLLDALQALLGDGVEITVGLCYAGGKSIAWHATQAERDTKIYPLRIITTGGTWHNVGKYTSAEALAWTDWDAVVLQPSQAEARAGVDSNRNGDSEDEKFYDYDASVPYMLDHISGHAPQAEIYYYELWATDKTAALNTSLSNYNKIASVTLDALAYIGTENSYVFSDAVPVGAAIQTARSTYLALLNYNQDEAISLQTDPQFGLQRDVSHLSFNIGRYIAAMTVAETLIPDELRVDGYSLPSTRITESIGALPGQYNELALEAVNRAVGRWHGAEQTLTVLPIEGYETDPTPGTADALSGYTYTVCRAGSAEKLIQMISEAVSAKLPEDYTLTGVEIEYSPIPEADPQYKVTIRYGYTFASFYASVILKDHTLDSAVTLPTCTEQGYTTHICTECGYTFTDSYTGPLGHDYKATVTEPTCTEAGYTTHVCSRCGDNYIDERTDALGHDYVSTVTEPTCTEAGYTTHVCSRCEDTYVDAHTNALGHDYVSTVTEPTCTEAGYTTHVCSRCGDNYVDAHTDALGHDYVSTVTEPTCTEAGYTTHICSRCGDNYIDGHADALGHDYVSTVTEPTCTEAGYTTHVCSRCGDNYVDAHTDALGHCFEEHKGDDGLIRHICVRCGEEKGFLPGDFNGDGVVNGLDLILLRKYLAAYDFGTGKCSVGIIICADLDGDGVITGLDLIRLRKYLNSLNI